MQTSSTVRQYLHAIRQVPRRSLLDEQASVARAVGGDADAIEPLVLTNLSYIVGIAKEFRGRGVPFEDLIAEGCVGLLKAIRHYRPERGTRFMTYASFWIRREILCAVAEQPHTIHVPHSARERGLRSVRMMHLDAPEAHDGTRALGERLPHPDPSPTADLLEEERKLQVRREVLGLEPRERLVLTWRFGLGGEPERTLKDVAVRLGLSRERVRQIEAVALERLRDSVSRRRAPRGN